MRKSQAEKVCGWVRKTGDKREKKVYNVRGFSADTCYCHHYSRSGLHLVLNGLRSTEAHTCNGVMYYQMFAKGLKCKKPNRSNTPCSASKCAFIREGKVCPYSR